MADTPNDLPQRPGTRGRERLGTLAGGFHFRGTSASNTPLSVDAARMRDARLDPRRRAAEQQRDTAARAAARQDPEYGAAEQQHHRDREGWAVGQHHHQDPERRAAEQQRNTAARAAARQDPERRAAEQQRNTAARAAARQDPERRAAEQQRNTAARAAARQDPERRAAEQQRDTAARAAARQDPEHRAAEQQRDTAARAAARQDPEHRAAQQQRNTAARAAARQDPERRAAEQERDTAAHAQGRAQVHAIQHPQASLLEHLRNLMRFPCLHEGQHPRPPDFLEAIPEGRVQDLPGGELPVDRQVPYEKHLHLASRMAAALRRRMPSRVCAVCSEQCSEEQSTLRAWLDIPNVDLLRADIMCTAAVPRHARTLAWRRMPCTAQDEDALAVDSDGGHNGTNEPGAADDAATMQLPPELQPHPPRVQPRPCVDDPISVEVPFCMRLDTELPNRTRRHQLSQQSPVVRALLDGARASLLRIDLTDAYYNGAKATMRAAALTIGWPPLFFNLNPADMHASCAVVASGQVIDFDDAGRPTHISSTVEKWRRVKEDPHSCAALLIATKEVLVEHLFGFTPGAMRQTDPNCFCGVVFEVVVKIEQSGRLALHLHGVAHLQYFALDNLQALFCGPNCRALALAYALCEMWYPSPYYAPTPTNEMQPLVMGMSNTEAQQHGLSVPEVQANCPPAAYDFECLAGSTCKRHGCRGTDDSCGMAFPRFIRTAFQWVGTTGLFLLPRLASNLVPHMPAIALAFGCNHLMSLACEVDRDYTADIAAQLARPINERGDCPLLQPTIDRARDAAYYSSKYTAKTIERSQAHLTCTAVGRVQDFMMAGHQPSATGHEPSVFGNLCTAVHRMTATITAGMALVAFKLSGHDTFQATYKRNYLATGAFTALASDSAVEPEDAETGVELVEADEHGDYTLANVVQNYTQRGVELSGLDCSAYTIASNFEVKRVTPAQHPHAAVLGAQTHAVPGRRKRKVPGAAITPMTDAPRAPSGNQPDTPLTSPAPAGPSVEQLPTNPTSTIPPKNVAFQPTHPLYLTHVLHRLAQPRYVVLGGKLPRRPQAESTTAAATAYYAFVLGVFKAHRGQPVAADQTVKEAYDAWWMDLGTTETGRSYRACISVLLDNIEAEHIAGARRQADYNLRRRLRRTAAANAGLAPENSSSDPDDEDPEAARRHLEPDPTTQPPQDAQVERYDFVPGQGDPTMGINLPDIALTDLYDRTTVEGLYAYGAFTALASDSAVEPEDAETGVELVEADEHGDYTLANVVQNYTQRGVELSGLDCSAYTIASNFEVKRVTPAQHPHAAVLGAQTHAVPGRRKRKVPGAAITPTTDAPRAPSGNQPDTPLTSPAPAGPSVEQLPTNPTSTIPPKNVAFQPTHPLYLTHVLHRLAQPRYVVLGGKLPRRPQAESTTAAATAYYAFVLGVFKAHRGQPVAADQTVKEAYDAWWMDLGTTETGRSYRACISVLLDNIEAEHIAGARRQADYNLRRRLRRTAAANAGLAPENSSSDPDDEDPEAARRHLEPDPTTQPPQDAQVERYDFVPGQGDPTMGINLPDIALTDLYDRTTVEGLYAYGAARRCRVLPLPDALGANTNPFIRRRECQTYLRLARPPTIDETIELFTLAPDQAVPFMLMARYFDRRNQPDPGVPPQMLVMGPPGTGKTQFVHALLWYTYQHDSPDWAATCAYSWAAAIAFNTPVHRSLSTHSMFGISASQSGSRGTNFPKRGAHAGLQVKRNVGDGAVLIDEIGMQSHEHLGAISHSCTASLPPPPHLGPAHDSSRILSGRAAGGIGDLLQHPQPGGSPPYRYAADVERNPQFTPSAPTAQRTPASLDEGRGHRHDDSNNDNTDADDDTGNRRATTSTHRTRRPVPQTHTRLHDGFNLYRQLGGTVFMLQKQQRQDNSPSGQQLTRFATMFGGIPTTEAHVADLVDALNQRVITDLSDLTDLEPRVVLQRNEPRHALNTRLLMLQARRKGARLVSWNADHVPVRQHGATQQQALSHVEKAVAMRVKDATFDHTTADTWYYEGARYTLLDTTAADAGACHNNEVEACGLLTDSREPPDDGRGPYWRLHYLPAAVLVRPIKGHAPKAVLADLSDFAAKGAAFAIVPRPSPAANITVPAANTGTTTKNVRRVNVPLGDYYAVTDYFVQGRSFKEECWVADLSVPPDPVLPARYRIGRSERASSAGIGGDPDRAAFVDEDALAVDSDGGDNGTNEPGAADDAATMQLPPELQPHPPRVQPRPCVDDPISVEVPFCMRLDTELPNRTVFPHDDAPDEFTICTSCEKALAARRIPEAALARLDPGDVPSVNHLGDPLPAPTFVESQLLGRGRLMQQLMIVHLAGRPPEVLPCAVQSHGIAVVNPDPNMLRGQLPARVADLAGAFTVVCVDQVRDRQDLLDRVRRAPGLKVRGNVVVAWVRFLQHNDEDEGAVDEEAIQEYERMGCIAQVPEALLRSAIGPTDPEVAGVLRSTFLHDRTGAAGVRQLHETLQGNIVGNNFDGGGVYGSPLETAADDTTAGPTGTANDILHDAGAYGPPLRTGPDVPAPGTTTSDTRMADAGATGLAPVAVVLRQPGDPADANLGIPNELEVVLPQPAPVPTDGTDFDNRPNVVHDLLTGRARLAFAAGGRGAQILDDRHPAILNVCFPVSFPYGLSGQRPPGMSFASYCSHLVRRVPRAQFSGNLMLLARMYDISVRQQSMAQVGVALRMRPRLGGAAALVPRDVVRTMADILALPYRHAQRRHQLSQQSPVVRALLDGARASLLRIDLTDAYYNGAKATMRAAALTIGWPPLFFNLNPADMHASCAVVASGQVIDFDDAGRPTHISSTVEKWRRVKEDPHSCAALLIATKEVLVEHLFGFTPGAMRQTDPNCFCGVVFEVVVKIEQSGRLALHLHGVAHLQYFALDNLQALFCGPNCRALALAYALCEMWYPSPYYAPTPTNEMQPLVMGMSNTEAQQHGLSVPEVQANCPPAAYDFECLAGSTCKRHGCRGTDDSCGMAFPRFIRTAFQWVGTTGLFLLPRLASNLVPHMPAIALAFGCNHLMSLACEVDRDYTADIAAQLARPINERGDCPLLQPTIDRARDAAYYSSKYTAKTIERSQAHLTCTAVGRVQDFMMAAVLVNGTQQSDRITAGMPTYLRLARPPTIDETIELFTLAPDQAVPFMLMARYFDRRNQPDPGVPPQMLVMGPPGTGKTQFVHALLWYTYQHDSPDWAATCAYSWAAAIAFNTPVHRSLSTHSMFGISASQSGSRGTNFPKRGAHAGLQVKRNVGDGAVLIDEIGMQSHEHLGAISHSCTASLPPPPHLGPAHDSSRVLSGRAAGGIGDLLQHPQPGGSPPYRYAADVERNPQFTPSAPTAQRTPASLDEGRGHRHDDSNNDNTDADDDTGNRRATTSTRRTHRPVPQTHTRLHDGFNLYRQLGGTVFMLQKQQRQDNSPSGQQLTRFATMFGGIPTTEARVADLVDALNQRVITDLSDLTDLEPRVVLQRNEPRHALNTRLLMLQARRKGARLVSWNADHVPVRQHAATQQQALSHVEKAVAMRVKDATFDHTTADTWYYEGARYTLLDTTAADAGACHNNEVEACGLLTDSPVLVNGTQQSDRITAGMPTYLRLARPPTIDETIELFTLAPDQAVPFMLMARYFDRRNQPDPGVPPQMLVMGPPGTGKTQFVHALLWYTYQHDSPDWAATCAYSWAAAIAFNTPVHRSLSTHSMFGISASQSGSRGTNFPKRGAHAGLQVKHNVGDGAVLIDEIGMQSHEHLGAISHSCTASLPPPPHLGPAHDSSRVLSGRAAGGIGDLLQHPQPGGSPPYRYAADVERNPQFTPSAPTAQRTPASLDEGRGHRHDDSNNDNTDADDDTGNRRATTSTRRTRRPVPQTHTRLHDGFNLYRQLGGTVFMLQKQQRQDNSPSGQQLTRFATMFGGIPTTEAHVADLVDALNQRVITDLSDLTDLEPRVVLQRNEPRHALNTRLLMLQARRKGARLVSWNADHVPVRQHGATQQQALSHVEKAVAMRVKDATFDHTTADTWYYEGARYTLLDTTAADAGACHNNEVEACGLLTDSREPPDDGRGPYWRLHYLPAAVLVRPIKGHAPKAVLADLSDFAAKGAAFAIVPRPSPAANITVPAANTGTTTKNVRRVNVPLGDYYAVTDYFVQGRSFKEECWVADLSVPPGGLKRATMYVLLTRYKTLDHIRLLRPLSTTPDERTRVVKQFMAATKLDPDLAAELRLLDRRATETRERYTTEYKHARNLEERWTSAANTT
ncbi:hypothetical protein VOLCADRAFT_88986 [Volvox carteri f. nagariensis]|uniref:AAA+ ATPase domain-containing protein n=1 Tax=Volvox carteri f. nagariensis TaxID=3068 RepID=D8TQH2_VOLCA|nr:uncharacterized protein VOLCADRAFT_88986 [Volvox carteri f. nagariensis]EFJ50152.1 hypothetical protein VOLCADRAFT_88986 [Volvox carteri f. nagariensis]|eukprot:XP_002948772.1 hypothetical protein VOLCADRAFT_88986 [Volvox carteri f. nagariensis]